MIIVCDQCGKEIAETNVHNIRYNGNRMTVCGKHYTQYVKYGHFLDNSPKSIQDINEYDITPEGVIIYTHTKSGELSGQFMIDLDDLDRVISHKWRFWKGEYFTGNMNPVTISRFIKNVIDRPDVVIDHINGDRTDNRKSNLRITTQQNNLLNKAILANNTSEIAGVWWDKERDKWVAEIKIDGIKCQLGRYLLKEDAVFARYFAENLLFKQYRSTRNDQKIFEYLNMCKNKEAIASFTYYKLREKYNI